VIWSFSQPASGRIQEPCSYRRGEGTTEFRISMLLIASRRASENRVGGSPRGPSRRQEEASATVMWACKDILGPHASDRWFPRSRGVEEERVKRQTALVNLTASGSRVLHCCSVKTNDGMLRAAQCIVPLADGRHGN
jgi:hypothetical protein